jgi:hypothetical protein
MSLRQKILFFMARFACIATFSALQASGFTFKFFHAFGVFFQVIPEFFQEGEEDAHKKVGEGYDYTEFATALKKNT